MTQKNGDTNMTGNNPNQNRNEAVAKPKQLKGFRGMDIAKGNEKGVRSSEEVAAIREKNIAANEKNSKHSKDRI